MSDAIVEQTVDLLASEGVEERFAKIGIGMMVVGTILIGYGVYRVISLAMEERKIQKEHEEVSKRITETLELVKGKVQ